MVPHVEQCADNLEQYFAAAADSGEVLEAKDIFGKYAIDAIATSGFGIELNSFEEPDSLFRIMALRMDRLVFFTDNKILNVVLW